MFDASRRRLASDSSPSAGSPAPLILGVRYFPQPLLRVCIVIIASGSLTNRDVLQTASSWLSTCSSPSRAHPLTSTRDRSTSSASMVDSIPLPVVERATSLGSQAASAALRDAVLLQLNISSDAHPPGGHLLPPTLLPSVVAAHLQAGPAHWRPWRAPRLARSGHLQDSNDSGSLGWITVAPWNSRAACTSVLVIDSISLIARSTTALP